MVLESHHSKMQSTDMGLWKTDPKDEQAETEKSNFNVHILLQSLGSCSTWWKLITKRTKTLKAKLISFVHINMD